MLFCVYKCIFPEKVHYQFHSLVVLLTKCVHKWNQRGTESSYSLPPIVLQHEKGALHIQILLQGPGKIWQSISSWPPMIVGIRCSRLGWWCGRQLGEWRNITNISVFTRSWLISFGMCPWTNTKNIFLNDF